MSVGVKSNGEWGIIHKGAGVHVSAHDSIAALLDQVAYLYWQENVKAGKDALAQFDQWAAGIRKVIIEEQS